MSFFQPQVIERFSLVALLGLRFRDVVTGAIIGDGLRVTAYPQGQPHRGVRAVPNRSGVYVLNSAPGLTMYARGQGDAEFRDASPPQKNFTVEVLDEERRFQPFQIIAQIRPERGLFKWPTSFDASPSLLSESVPLYSSPTRIVPGGMSVIRAELWDRVANQPASWAVLEARLNNLLLARGIADGEGKIALIFPNPAPQSAPLSSPPVIGGAALTEQVWEIALRARYAPPPALASPPQPVRDAPALPDLRDTLTQPIAMLWADAEGVEELTEVSLRYGEELVLRSRAAHTLSPPSPPSPPTRSSALLVSPAV